MDRGKAMFEDSLMESSNRIKAKSSYWSMVSLLLNGGALIAVTLFPLLHPGALPTDVIAPLLVAPTPPPPTPPAPQTPKVQTKPETLTKELQAPSKIPKESKLVKEAAIPPAMDGVKGIEGIENGTPGGMSTIIDGIGTGPPQIKKHTSGLSIPSVNISSGVMAGNLVDRAVPQYPAIARAARIQGVVVLQATISTTGLIKNLRVITGPPMLQQAAMDAVRSWRYRPYLLNGSPVEVETTINVVFNLGE
jgi:periplasmic protein TonB